ncbi:helix-turn-helix transcriptional regulator [Candidatus Enterococcus ferrettii]|uniref:HTH deoR-type domain-containing protein n=1 Tax=Candidatus Enterococcus ferrettii TaxID=2815324 RepID=A0ABV0ETL9_9ENTE|nr:YafY family protein [Enterococcus sp. 665A]MBO1342234.1 YafY family transcriptional regulator [Enterococcus sp. 665A]
MKTNRMIHLLFYLLRQRKTTAVHLAGKFGVSLRTIYRDLDQLSQAGVPLYTTTGRNGGVALMEDFVLDRTFFTQTEQSELMVALSSLAATGFVEIDSLQEKLTSLRKEAAEPLLVNFSRWGVDPAQEAELFNQIKKAILEHQVLAINYLNSQGEEGWRRIEPQKLVFQENQWYVLGFCRCKADVRLFRLSRILELEQSKETFKPNASIEKHFNQIQRSFSERILVKLTTSQAVKHRLVDIFGREAVQTIGYAVQVETKLPIDEWLISFCLSLGSELQEIHPVELEEAVTAEHQKAYKQLRRNK